MKERAGEREGEGKRNWEVRCGTGRGMPRLFGVACAALRCAARLGSARRDATRRGAVCHAVVLPADIFIGGRATCNRLRGIRIERCFAHLYPRFAARPIQRQPSLFVLALSRFSLPPSFPSLSHLSFFHLVSSLPSPPALSLSARCR